MFLIIFLLLCVLGIAVVAFATMGLFTIKVGEVAVSVARHSRFGLFEKVVGTIALIVIFIVVAMGISPPEHAVVAQHAVVAHHVTAAATGHDPRLCLDGVKEFCH